MTDTLYKLVSFKLCPFVQRSLITLLEKGASYDIQYIDLAIKPDWFLKLSPLGKVPILILGDEVLFESAVINEFLDETAGEGRLMPDDPLLRARHRAWISVGTDILPSLFKMQHAADEQACLKYARAARDTLSLFEEELGSGPYFSGEAFTLVDASMAPALQRAAWCQELTPVLDLFGNLPEVAAWCDALLARESVIGSTVPEIRELFIAYGKGMKARDGEPAWFGQQL